MFFLTRFPHAARVFFEMATLTIVWFLHTQSHFFMFRVVAFFREENTKKQSTTAVRKKPQKTTLRVAVLGPEIHENRRWNGRNS